MPDLLTDGDAIERATWIDLKTYFPHYETFWRQHLYPLRAPGTVQIRNGLNDRFERLAMSHYSTYVSLARAHTKLLSREDWLFPDEIYWNLFRASELAADHVVPLFLEICQECLNDRPHVNVAALNRILERIRPYRNLIHGPIQAVAADEVNRPLLPRRDQLDRYAKWSDTFNTASGSDFVDALQQLNDDFRALSSALETAWSDMCGISNRLDSSKRYLEQRDAGMQNNANQEQYGRVSVGMRFSSAGSGASFSATTAGQVISIAGPPKSPSSS